MLMSTISWKCSILIYKNIVCVHRSKTVLVLLIYLISVSCYFCEHRRPSGDPYDDIEDHIQTSCQNYQARFSAMLDKVRQENARKEAEIKKMEDKILNLRTEIKSSCDTIKVSMMEYFQSCLRHQGSPQEGFWLENPICSGSKVNFNKVFFTVRMLKNSGNTVRTQRYVIP